MKLVIPYSDSYNEDFILFLVQQLRKEILGNLNHKKLKRLNQDLFNLFNFNLSFLEIIQTALKNLILFESKNGFQIQINPAVKFLNTNLNLNYLINIGTYGTLDIKGYPIIAEIFNKIKSNLPYYFRYYKATHGIGVGYVT